MLMKIRAIAGDAPVIAAGDFNSTPDTEQVRTMQAALADARLATTAPPYGPEGTFSGFDAAAPLDQRIDYVFVNARVKVLKYAALTDSRNGRFPSDHLPVVVRVEIDPR